MDVVNFHDYIDLWAEDLERLRQNRLLGENEFLAFVQRCGVLGVRGLPPDSESLQSLLGVDCRDHRGGGLFHPFRFSVAYESLSRSPGPKLLDEAVQISKQVVDLAVLLEPLSWPWITGRHRFNDCISEDAYFTRLGIYRGSVLNIVKTLDVSIWRDRHAKLCAAATRMDSNQELYLLLRLSAWDRRQELTGQISGALWIRHIAEVIRLGFEEAHAQEWREEDQAFETLRERLLGSKRILDSPSLSRRHIARRFELFSGSAVRWYLEGPTEYYAVQEIFGAPALYGIELMNLSGKIAADKNNIALQIQQWLREDNGLKRFSIITFDRDVMPNEKTIRQQAELIVGSVFANDPDFEFANLTIEELVSVAAQLDEEAGFSGAALREGDWTGITKGKDFEKKYTGLSETGRNLKGEKWGRALARYMEQNPLRADGKQRPFREALMHAALAQSSNYDFDKQTFQIDPHTFQRKQRSLGL
jgi:hypothetical protein